MPPKILILGCMVFKFFALIFTHIVSVTEFCDIHFLKQKFKKRMPKIILNIQNIIIKSVVQQTQYVHFYYYLV